MRVCVCARGCVCVCVCVCVIGALKLIPTPDLRISLSGENYWANIGQRNMAWRQESEGGDKLLATGMTWLGRESYPLLWRRLRPPCVVVGMHDAFGLMRACYFDGTGLRALDWDWINGWSGLAPQESGTCETTMSPSPFTDLNNPVLQAPRTTCRSRWTKKQQHEVSHVEVSAPVSNCLPRLAQAPHASSSPTSPSSAWAGLRGQKIDTRLKHTRTQEKQRQWKHITNT